MPRSECTRPMLAPSGLLSPAQSCPLSPCCRHVRLSQARQEMGRSCDQGPETLPSLITAWIAKARGQHLCSAGPRSVTWPPALPPSVESVPPGGHEEFRLTPQPLVLLTTLNGLLPSQMGR